MPSLFDPVDIGGITVRNRIWLSPMCQSSVETFDGVPADWHLVHLGGRAAGGFGLVLTEATAVCPEGRISPYDTGLWTDEQAMAWSRITPFLREYGATPAIQLSHAGRKASAWMPGRGVGPIAVADGGWEALGPSPTAFDDHPVPREMSAQDIADVHSAFVDATRRADAAGFDVVEIHAAHGYLLHEFLSPLANQRVDAYGGIFDNRIRLLIEVIDGVRAALPERKGLLVRLSATDWVEGGWTPEETVELAVRLAGRGVDLIDVSSGGLDPRQDIPVGPGYQVPFARDVRAEAGVPAGAVGLISDPRHAQSLLDDGSADVILLGRAALRESAWPLRAAHELGLPPTAAPYPRQYRRAAWRA